MHLLASFLFLLTPVELEAAIVKLKPNISSSTKEMVVSEIVSKTKKYGFTEQDYPLIVAMIHNESNFAHIFGEHGEIGMLQVIPEDGHITDIVSKLDCDDHETYCKNGTPDVFRNSEPKSWLVRRFLAKHPHYALETGFAEMRYWKNEYERTLKRRYWTKFPTWYLQARLDDFNSREKNLRWWWNNLRNKAGDFVWVSHYNWGSKLSTSAASRNYALRVVKIMNSI